ncbi:hypothetical protein [Hymenobacter persicinus]|uniref:Uncharacterized protein n=1 Tax=Hymenobacter persicinus TaxID=2025506 RepID=A0A4Q5LF82_9BACT|nr:hypothetical protein [Hymenobacter persicinus]RYU81269.1 hypothetical protein EWM57_06750 [Hymenobacter persicinus]
MALDVAQFQQVLDLASKSEATSKELRKALNRIQSAVQNLDVAVGDAIAILDGGVEPKQKKPYSGKPRGRRKKEAGGTQAMLEGIQATAAGDTASDTAALASTIESTSKKAGKGK